jgi:probable 2-oxoglutarate dehydrogenase E1 component DHKTD1
MGPKTLLRLPEATSSLKEMGPNSTFEPVFDDASIPDPSKVKQIMFCSGKIYYDLVKERQKAGTHKQEEVALVRLEELSPFPFQQVDKILKKYADSKVKLTWIQEEPLNQGAWNYLLPHFQKLTSQKLEYIGRQSLAASAVGLSKRNAAESKEIFIKAFGNLI